VESGDEALTAATRLEGLETPALVLDRARLMRNLARMADRARRLGVALRPHLKTVKSVDIARLVVDPERPRLTVSTLKEADHFAAAGFGDILYAVGIAPNKVAHAAALRRAGVELTLLLDSLEAVRALGAAALEQGVDFAVMIEIDTDGHRAGVKPADVRLVAIARAIAEHPALRLAGVLTHAGASYDCASPDAIARVAEQERSRAIAAAARIRHAGLDCPEVSIGSTPTAIFAKGMDGVTELRAGVYMTMDLVMAGLGVCAIDDIAVSVLAAVIGHQPDKGQIIIDAGWMALSRDPGAADHGYGLVCTEEGRALRDAIVTGVNQEHGIIAARPGAAPLDLSRFPIGARLRILPNHACATVAQHDRYRVVGPDGLTVEAEWPRFGGW
jgi:D-serine deaminase-like pyridoxal phosphate-dependent protein